MRHSQKSPCGCEITGTGTEENPLRIVFCPLHHNYQGAIAIALVRMEQLKQSIERRNWTETEFQFDRVLRALTKQNQP